MRQASGVDTMLADAWEHLETCVGVGHPGVASVDAAGRPQARTVVLRAADRNRRTLVFYTDRRSEKSGQLEGGLAWTFYDAERRLQVRAWGPSEFADDASAERHWMGSTLASRKCYLVEPGPGTPSDGPTSGHRGRLDAAVVPTEAEVSTGRDNFAVVVTTVRELDVLYILRSGHRRARFAYEDGWHGSWVVP